MRCRWHLLDAARRLGRDATQPSFRQLCGTRFSLVFLCPSCVSRVTPKDELEATDEHEEEEAVGFAECLGAVLHEVSRRLGLCHAESKTERLKHLYL